MCDCGHEYALHEKSLRGKLICVYRDPRTDDPCYCDQLTITMKKVRKTTPWLRRFWRTSRATARCGRFPRETDKQRSSPVRRSMSQIVGNRERNLRVRVFVDKHPNFERSDGGLIDKSWLRLQALPPDNEHIGLGITKCRAICELEKELLQWIQKIRNCSKERRRQGGAP